MGNCLGKKRQCKRNAVAPAPEDDVCERISRVTPRPGSSSINPADMTKQIEESHFENSKIAPGGVSFVLDVKDGNPARMPQRLASRMDGVCSPAINEDEFHYTTEERQLMAEINRENIIKEKKEKAIRRDIKVYDAARRRAARKLIADPENNVKTEEQTNE